MTPDSINSAKYNEYQLLIIPTAKWSWKNLKLNCTYVKLSPSLGTVLQTNKPFHTLFDHYYEDIFLQRFRKCFRGSSQSLCAFQNSKFSFLYTSSAPTKSNAFSLSCNKTSSASASCDTSPFLNCFSMHAIASSAFTRIPCWGYTSRSDSKNTAVSGASRSNAMVLLSEPMIPCCCGVILA